MCRRHSTFNSNGTSGCRFTQATSLPVRRRLAWQERLPCSCVSLVLSAFCRIVCGCADAGGIREAARRYIRARAHVGSVHHGEHERAHAAVRRQAARSGRLVRPRRAKDDFWVMPDNGFGAKDNSADYVLRAVSHLAAISRRSTAAPERSRSRRSSRCAIPTTRSRFRSSPTSSSIRTAAFPLIRHPAASLAHGRRLRHRVGSRGARRHALVRRRVRSVPDSHGRHRQGARRAVSAARACSSPQNPFLGTGTPNLPRSKGFEGMAIARDGQDPLSDARGRADDRSRSAPADHQRVRACKSRRYTGRQWFYRLEDPRGQSPSATSRRSTDRTFLVIERDNFEGAAALVQEDLSRRLRRGGQRRLPRQDARWPTC